MLCGYVCQAHAWPCLSTGWKLNCCFAWFFGLRPRLRKAGGYSVRPWVCLVVQHRDSGQWLHCPSNWNEFPLDESVRAERAQHIHNSRLLPVKNTDKLPEGDVYAIVTPKGGPDVGLKLVLHHVKILQNYIHMFYNQQYSYNSTQIRQVAPLGALQGEAQAGLRLNVSWAGVLCPPETRGGTCNTC